MRTVLALVALSVAASLAGAAYPASQTIDMKDLAFQYATVAVNRDEPVTWRNVDTVDHNIFSLLCPGDCRFDAGRMAPGTSFTFTPTTAGTLVAACQIHNFMFNRVLVQSNDPRDPSPRVTAADVRVGNDGVAAGPAFVPIPYRYRVDALVTNTGGAAARQVLVEVTVLRPDAERIPLLSTRVDVPAGGEVALAAVWDASALAVDGEGDYRVDVTVDPRNTLVEMAEWDNFESRWLRLATGGLAGP